jgi:hypothetical protein
MKAAHVEGRLSNHATLDNSSVKLEKLRSDPRGPNPFLESASDMDRYAKIQDKCIAAIIDQLP